MNEFWDEKNQFWRNKTTQNAIYQKQKEEIAADIYNLAIDDRWNSFLDVGGYDGHLGQEIANTLPYKHEYKSIDFLTGFDITKSWQEQGLTNEYDVVIVSLVLLTIPPEKLEALVDEIFAHAKHAVYIFDEDPGEKKHGEVVNENYGGKWIVRINSLLKGRYPLNRIRVETSLVNKKWVKYTIVK